MNNHDTVAFANEEWMTIRVCWLKYAIATVFVLLACGAEASALSPQDTIHSVIGSPNNQFRVVNTYPEYWVDGNHSSCTAGHSLPPHST
jgi:hypothetical protein